MYIPCHSTFSHQCNAYFPEQCPKIPKEGEKKKKKRKRLLLKLETQ